MSKAEEQHQIVPANAPEHTPVVSTLGAGIYALTSDLHVRGNEIYLPQSKPVEPDSPEYLELFTDALPDDVAAEVRPALLQSRTQYGLLTVMLCVTFLVLTAFAVYDFMPRPRVEALTNEIARGDAANPFSLERANRKEYDEAKTLFQKEEYVDAVAALEPKVKELAEKKQTIKDNRELFYLYFSAAQKNLAAYPGAEALIAKVQELDPDSAVWRLFKLWFGAPECRYFGYRKIGSKPDLARAEELRKLLAETEPAAVGATHDQQDVQLDFYRAQLLYAIWLYQGDLEFDQFDPGVAEREEAYRITSKHLDNKDFLELRRDIAQKILDAMPVSEWYYFFDGIKRFKKDSLKRTIDEVNQRLAAGKEAEK